MGETIREITEQLSRIFRHLLPGVLVVGAAYVSHPTKWFGSLKNLGTTETVVLVAITLAAGNLWYVCHRYTIHQLIDYILYRCEKNNGITGYVQWLAGFVDDSFRSYDSAQKYRDHLHLRSSQIILMFIAGEVIIVFACFHEPNTLFSRHQCLIRAVGICLLSFAGLQYWISRTLEIEAVKKYTAKLDSANKAKKRQRSR